MAADLVPDDIKDASRSTSLSTSSELRQEEIRDKLVEATLQAAEAEMLLEIAEQSPEAFINLMKGESVSACSGNACATQAVKAENETLRARVAWLEQQIQALTKHIAQQQSDQQGKY